MVVDVEESDEILISQMKSDRVSFNVFSFRLCETRLNSCNGLSLLGLNYKRSLMLHSI